MSVLFNFYPALRPLLFSMDAEAAHHRSLTWLKTLSSCRLTGHCRRQHVAGKPVRIIGLERPNPVGLAAGLDKNGAYVDVLASLRVGFIDVVIVMAGPECGNLGTAI